MANITRLQKFINSINIAKDIDQEKLDEIGAQVLAGYDADDNSRQEWKATIDKALKIAKQIMEDKTTPWPGASNVKYPLLPVACLQFNARMYPEIVKGDRAVKTMVFGKDPDGVIAKMAEFISKHLSYQLLEEIPAWEEDMDKLFMTLPLFGHIFKKVYYDPLENKPVISFCLPHDVVVNQSIQSLEKARRISHIIHLYANEIRERIEAGIFIELEKEELEIVSTPDNSNLFPSQRKDNPGMQANAQEDDALHKLIEQQCYLDLDDDDYKEPYIVTVDVVTQKVLRIVANYDEESLILKNDKLVKIKPISYFSDYKFLPASDGTYYGVGFGQLLYPINEAVNSLHNNLIDAGTLANRGGGFVDSRTGWSAGNVAFKIGEWKKVSVPIGTNLSQSIFPIPVRDPSSVLFQLLGMLIQAAKEISNVSDVLQGQQPAQNVPATTILALIEQGQKVYNAIQKRIYLSMRKELQLLADINKRHMDDEEYFGDAVKIGLIDPSYYGLEHVSIYPIIDPAMSSQAMRLARAQALMQVSADPLVNKWEILKEYLQAIDVENWEVILPEQAEPQPSVAEQKTMAETSLINMEKAKVMFDMDNKAYRYLLDHKQLEVNAAQVAANVKQMEHNTVIAHEQIALELEKLVQQYGLKALEADLSIATSLLTAQGKQFAASEAAEEQPPEKILEEKAAVLAPTAGIKEMPIPSEVEAQKEQVMQQQQAAAQQSQSDKEGAAQVTMPELPNSQADDNMNIPTAGNPQKPSPAGTQELIEQGAI